MADLPEKLRTLDSRINQILSISGSPGLSLGVLHEGRVVHTAHFGHHNVETDEIANDDTIYHVVSLTKLITAATVAALVDKGILEWDVPIRNYIPEFGKRKDELGQLCTLRDLLSNRTGLPLADAYWGQKGGEFLLPREEIIPTICSLKLRQPFRSSFVYNNWNYGLVGEIVAAVTGKSFGQSARDMILDPLDISRTSFVPEEGQNVAPAYAVLESGQPYRISHPNMSDKVGLGGSFAMRSSIRDLLTLYRSLLEAYTIQSKGVPTSEQVSPFRQVPSLFTPQVPLPKSRIEESSYCMGLYRSVLPQNLGVSSLNNALLGFKRMPIVGGHSSGTAVYHHSGNCPGSLASSFFIPSTQTAVAVVTNSLAFMDPTNFIGQLIVLTILGESQLPDFVPLARLGRSVFLKSYQGLVELLESQKTSVAPQYPLTAYEGEYFNAIGNFSMSFQRQGEGLLMVVQNMPLTRYNLIPYDGNTFYWPACRDEEVKNCMWPVMSPGYHKLTFEATRSHAIGQVLWQHDPFFKPEAFRKRDTTAGIGVEKL